MENSLAGSVQQLGRDIVYISLALIILRYCTHSKAGGVVDRLTVSLHFVASLDFFKNLNTNHQLAGNSYCPSVDEFGFN